MRSGCGRLQGFRSGAANGRDRQYARIGADLRRFGNFGAEVPEIRHDGFILQAEPRASGIQVRLTTLHPPPDLVEIDAVVIRVAQSLTVMKEGTREKRHLSLQQLLAPVGKQHQKGV
jgi:hypothetical protein